MKFLADENIYRETVDFLREKGFMVNTVGEVGLSGAEDGEVVRYSTSNKLILLTLDRRLPDIRFLPKEHSGIIVLRVRPASGEVINKTLLEFIQSNKSLDFSNKLIILETNRVRIRST